MALGIGSFIGSCRRLDRAQVVARSFGLRGLFVTIPRTHGARQDPPPLCSLDRWLIITRVTIGDSFREVLKAGSGGAQWALEALYWDLAPAVMGYLRAQGAAEPEDLTSEVFVGMVRGLQTFEGDERGFRSWVFSIAHRRLIDERRRLSVRHEDPVDPARIAGPLAGHMRGDVEEEALANLGRQWVMDALADLSLDQRTVLLLRVVADLSVAEVAGILGKSHGAVKMLQRRAFLKLARRIERQGVT
jgi:RNA polymerase sigma factor (sigma-70 family)